MKYINVYIVLHALSTRSRDLDLHVRFNFCDRFLYVNFSRDLKIKCYVLTIIVLILISRKLLSAILLLEMISPIITAI